MLNPRDYWSKRINSTSLIHDRCLYPQLENTICKRFQTHPSLLNRLELDAVLNGHEGCINCLEWGSNGRILASGSDDFQLCIWDPFKKKRIHSVHTKHFGNMFSVKFLPKHNDAFVATAAADKTIMLFDINHSQEAIYSCHCHEARVKRLATAPDSPYVFWSAAEDGNILQLDHREKHTCRSQDNRVCLLNLRTFVDTNAEAKCIAVNPVRTEQIAIGTNDPFARIYDRRMLKLTSSLDRSRTIFNFEGFGDCSVGEKTGLYQRKDGAIYLCPGHINKNRSRVIEHEARAITYLTFNSYGTELLVNMGTEHIYIYDLINGESPVFLNLPEYKECDNREEDKESKLVTSIAKSVEDSNLSNNEAKSSLSSVNLEGGVSSDSLTVDDLSSKPEDNNTTNTNTTSSTSSTLPTTNSINTSQETNNTNVPSSRSKLPDKIYDLKFRGNKFLEHEKYQRAISLYSEAISLDSQWPVLYLNRATAYMRRLWFGDIYAALRDCHMALRLDVTYIKAHFRLARALLELGRTQDADECLQELIRRFPSYANNHGVLMLEKDIRENRQTTQQQQQQQQQRQNRYQHLERQIIATHVRNNSVDQSDNREDNRENSDAGDNGDNEVSDRVENCASNGSLFSRYDLTMEEYYWRTKAIDYSQRFVGHCNITTDIKEANYFGNNNDYIVAGSDDGNLYIWDRSTCNLHSVYKADSAIVNCVLPHPNICMIATSGIDYSIKLWSPMNFEVRPNVISAFDLCVERNQMKMKSDPFDISTRNYLCWNG